MPTIKEEFLLVDDDPKILEGYSLRFKSALNLYTASSAWEALELIKKHKFASIISDYNLPDMNGLELILNAKKIYPQSVCILLTGEANLDLALEAINNGNVFRFLVKPCNQKVVAEVVIQAIRQYRLEQSEINFINGTLSETALLLSNTLSIVNPSIFYRTEKLLKYVNLVCEQMKLKNAWEIKLAAIFSQIGFATIPLPISKKIIEEEELSDKEKDILAKVPEIGEQMLENIPRFENIAKIVKYNSKNFDGQGYPNDNIKGLDIPLGSRILRILDKIIRLEEKFTTIKQIINHMKTQIHKFDPDLFDKITAILLIDENNNEEIKVAIDELRIHDHLLTDIETVTGRKLFSKGNTVTKLVLARIYNYAELERLKEPITVIREKAN